MTSALKPAERPQSRCNLQGSTVSRVKGSLYEEFRPESHSLLIFSLKSHYLCRDL